MRDSSKVRKFDVTLVAEFNLDLLLYGLPQELPVERELLADRIAMVLGGSPAITAHNLASLGNRIGFVTTIANDEFAAHCTRDLQAAGVDLSYALSLGERAATGCTVLLQHERTRRMLTYSGTTSHLRLDDLDLAYLSLAQHFHLSSYFLQTSLRGDIPRLFAQLKEAGITISLDTNDDPTGDWDRSLTEALRHVDVLLPNKQEACYMAHTETLEEAIAWLLQHVPTVIVKRGAAGALAATRDKRWEASAAIVQPVDAVGAGDSFNAGFLHGYIRGWPMERCLQYGNLAGAYSTTRAGGVAAFQDRTAQEEFFAAKVDVCGSF